MPKFIDLRGQRFGRLVVGERISSSGAKSIIWAAKCDCGSDCTVSGELLRSGKTKSCGCLRREVTGAINKAEDLPAKIRESIDIDQSSGCWVWNRYLTGKRYGGLYALGETKAHRVSYRVFKGNIPAGNVVCHKCDNPLCVNPEHLFLGTQQENIQDMDKKERRHPASGERNANAKITEKIVREARKRFLQGANYRALMKEYGFKSHSSFYAMINGITWSHVA